MIALLILMTFISFSMRIMPFLFSDRLQKNSLFEKIADTLPPCILLILVAHTLEVQSFSKYPFGIPEMGGLACITCAQILFRNILASMLAGIATHQIILHLL